MKVHKRTLRLHLFMDSFAPYIGNFLALSVPKNQVIPLGMPWLKAVNPDIDWIEETIKHRKIPSTDKAHKNQMKMKKVKSRIPTKPSKPALQVGGQRFSGSGNTNNSCSKHYQQGFFSVTSGETKYLTSKQFKGLLRKPHTSER
ncbi:unnamed protein product [Phytophthora fragariaefolia]|uniref:Unnamed protein product n=1 Tax=Phytophthora fragariaefolia TaxID=1490495 RepID=A0A9W6UCJ7_9STRA|nr:unnamed protein product [Phytophthora fragariaefolia]